MKLCEKFQAESFGVVGIMSLLSRNIFLPRCCGSFRRFGRAFVNEEPGANDFAFNEVCDSNVKLPHVPVMVKEVIKHLNLKEGDLFLDMTFGAGGHSKALLEEIPNLQVFALDRDPTALKFVSELQSKYPGQILPLTGKFSDLPKIFENYFVKQNTFNGVLFDLGCSSMQLDTPERGFSLSKDGPLDMRMGSDEELTAADLLAYVNQEDLMQILKIYGGERRAKRISQAIIQARARFKPLKTTKQLTDLVETVLEGVERTDRLNRKTNAATKVFQALRIFINNEINELNYGVQLAHYYLKPGGTAAVITFHSGEDQIVKRHFQNHMVDNRLDPLPLVYINPSKKYTKEEISDFQVHDWDVVNKHVIVPTDEEVNSNPRSRSAKLRVAIKHET